MCRFLPPRSVALPEARSALQLRPDAVWKLLHCVYQPEFARSAVTMSSEERTPTQGCAQIPFLLCWPVMTEDAGKLDNGAAEERGRAAMPSWASLFDVSEQTWLGCHGIPPGRRRI